MVAAVLCTQNVSAQNILGSVDAASLTGGLTLNQVIAEVLLKNPELQAFSLEVRAREARTLQAGLWPNPQLQVQSEDITGTGDFNSFRKTQTTVQLNQWIRLGGKIAKKERVAALSKDLAQWDYEVQRMNVLTRAGQAFIELLTRQEQLKLADDLIHLAETNFKTVSARVESGKVSSIQAVKAKVALSKTRLDREKVLSQLQSARRRLGLNWAEPNPRFDTVIGDIYTVEALPSYDVLLGQVEGNPNLTRWAAEMERRQAKVEFEKSKAIPDIQLQGAFRRIESDQANTLVMGITVPLNIFDRNQGGISEARHRLAKAEAEKSAIRLQLQTMLAEIYNQLTLSHRQATALKNEILPGAQTAFGAVQEGYRFGKFGLMDVLDSQRTFFESQSRYLEALGNYHKAVLAIERIIGEPLASFNLISIKPDGEREK